MKRATIVIMRTYRRHATRGLAAAAILAAGIAAALIVTGSAFAWTPNPLPAGFSIISHGTDGSSQSCPEWYRVSDSNTSPATNSGNLCTQADVDAWVNSQPQAPSTTTTTPTTTSTGASTTPAPTTTTTTAAPTGGATAPASTTTTVVTTTTTATTTTTPSTPPTASFTSAATGLSVTFTDTSTVTAPATLATVTWHYGDGFNGTGATATHVFTGSGTFTVVEIVTDSNGLASQASEGITVSPFGGARRFAEAPSAPLSTAATAVAHDQVALFCVSSWGNTRPERGLGLSIVGSHQANMWAKGCAALRTGHGPVALALLVAGHEVAHSLGVRGERAADCYALHRVPALARALRLGVASRGAVRADAALIAKRYGKACGK